MAVSGALASAQLSPRIALVTGASRGIGRAIAARLAAAGYRIAANAHEEGDLEAFCAEAQGTGLACHPFAGDVSDEGQVQAVVDRVARELGQIGILVNNAGTNLVKGIEDITPEEWDRILAVNLKSVFLCSKAVIPAMRSRRFGRIVNISSIAAKRGALFGDVHYSASKAGIIGFTRTLARQLAPDGITVNAVAPGLIATDLVKQNIQGQRLTEALALIPAGRLGTPEEVAELVAFLAGDMAGYITGATVDINGGAYMG